MIGNLKEGVFELDGFQATLDKRDWQDIGVGDHFMVVMFPSEIPDGQCNLSFYRFTEIPSEETAKVITDTFVAMTPGVDAALVFLTVTENQNEILCVEGVFTDYKQTFEYSTGVLNTVSRH